MRIDINGHQVEVTPALRDYVQDKLARIARHYDHHCEARVILAVDKLEHKAEATLSTAGKTLFADAIAADMYAAIDLLSDKLDRMVIKQKEKMTDQYRRGTPATRSDNFG
ncbi:MAG TPA: ribosome-associated translation inhibitor RaiA [Arenimonas sp.]|nr:ribosome-associated translation inhibitor RaiA [Arenimonas sp.]